MRRKIIFIAIIFAVIIISILLFFLFGEIFLFPLFCVFPLSCGSRNINSQENEHQESIPPSREKERFVVKEERSQTKNTFFSCPNCGELIKKPNLKYCPECGRKLPKIQ